MQPDAPQPLPPPRIMPADPVPPTMTLERPFLLCEFAQVFKPAPGNYDVLMIHPVTGCPIRVCFTLPPGCPRVCVGKRTLDFDYGCCSVTIRFTLLCGKVRVLYR